MYKEYRTAFGKYERLQVQDDKTGNSFSLVPEQGAVLLDVQLNGTSVLDGYQSAEKLEIAKWSKNRILIPFPNRLEDGTYRWDGGEYHFPIKEAEKERNVSVHGFKMHELPFEVIMTECTADHALVTCRYRSNGEHPSYPFAFTFEVIYSIHNSQNFQITFSYRNDGKVSIPAGLGWHSYFKLAETSNEMEMQLPPCEEIEVNERALPTGKRKEFTDFRQLEKIGDTELDNCFAVKAGTENATVENKHTLESATISSSSVTFSKTAIQPQTSGIVSSEGRAEFLLKGSDKTLRIWQETGKGKFNFFQVFTPIHRKSVAIEPMTCNINAFNNQQGLVILEPEAALVAKCGLELL